MAARSHAALTRALTDNPVFRLLPVLAQYAWLKLAANMIKQRLTVLRVGNNILSATEIAAFAGLTEVEWETYAPMLLRFGLLSVEDDGATGCPPLVSKPACASSDRQANSDRRAAASRLNGCKGGRPRKRPDPAQREAMMPITGGRTASIQRSAPIDTETCQVSQVSPAIAKPESKSLEAKLAVSNADVQKVGHAAAAAAGLQGRGHFGAVRQWLTAGATEELIVSTIEASMRLGRQPGHLGYFTKAIQEALESQAVTSAPAGSQAAGSTHSPKAFQAWNRAYEEWCLTNRRGPLPKVAWFADDGSRIAA